MKQFHQFQLDTANECLWQNGNRLVLNRKSFLVLETLVANAGRLLSKEELIELVWPDTYVGEENLKLYIWKLRRTLGEDPKTRIFMCLGQWGDAVRTLQDQSCRKERGRF